jgi:DNA-binding SARP family transcriptional activator
VTASAPIEMRLMGRFVVLSGGAEVPAASFGGRKVRMLLRILCTRRGQFVTHEVLTEMLWGDRPPSDPAANLQVLVNRARRATGNPDLIVTGSGGYSLTADRSCLIDTEDFLERVAVGDRASAGAALDAYRDALDRYGGEPLAEDRYSDWAEPYRTRVLRSRQRTLERAAELALRQDEPGLAVEFATAAADAEPLREGAVLALVRALAAAGDRAAALHRYDAYRRDLAQELGVDPSSAAQTVHAELLDGDLGHASPAARSTRTAVEVSRVRFVGRQHDADRIVAAVTSPRPDRSAVAAVGGLSGSGKTRLLGELAGRLGAIPVRATWPERTEPWALARSLLGEILAADVQAADGLPDHLRAALSALVPGLATPASAVLDPESRRALVVEGVVRLLDDSSRAPVLMVDDLQWADPTSLHLIAVVLARCPAVAAILAYRPDEVAAGGPVARFLQHLEPVLDLDLGPLPAEAIAELVHDRSLAAAVAGSTDRSPMAVGEVLRALAADGLAAAGADGRWHVRSEQAAVQRAIEVGTAGQRRAIGVRVGRLSGVPQEVLGLLALRAGGCPARFLAAASSTPEHATLRALGVLAAAGLARLGDLGWIVAHDMIGEVVVEQLPAADRVRLHVGLIRALEADGADQAELARHLLAAGDRARATLALANAAEDALAAYADIEAGTLANRGLAADPAPPVRARLLEALAETRRRRGDLGEARTGLRAALVLHTTGSGRARVLTGLAVLASGAEDLERAAELIELALVEAGGDDAVRGRALETAGIIDMNLGHGTRAHKRVTEALTIFQRTGDARGAARILDARAMDTFLAGNIRAGTELLGRAATLFEDYGDLSRLVTPLSTQGHGLVFLEQPQDGLARTSAALEVAQTLGHPEGQSYALWHRSEALSALGRADDALADGRAALAIAERIGHRGWTATAWRAIGIAHASHGNGDLDAALSAFTSSLEASEHLDLFACWAAARIALMHIALGRPDRARPMVRRALRTGPALGQYEARLAQVELAVAVSDPGWARMAARALQRANAGGSLAHSRRLQHIIDAST